MARKKTILKEDILQTAYEVVTAEGFKSLTARNIAKEMNCSTQPIYLEFKNMDQLKEMVTEKMQSFLYETVLAKEVTGHRLMDTCLNYIRFAKEEQPFFSALCLEGEVSPQEIHDLSYDYFKKAFKEDKSCNMIPIDKKADVFETVWPFVHGTAALVSQECLPYDEKMIVKNVHGLMDTVLSNEREKSTQSTFK